MEELFAIIAIIKKDCAKFVKMGKEFKELIIKKIPKEEQKKEEFGILLGFIEKNEIENVHDLFTLLEREKRLCRSWLLENKGAGTINKLRREYARKMEIYNNLLNMASSYLK